MLRVKKWILFSLLTAMLVGWGTTIFAASADSGKFTQEELNYIQNKKVLKAAILDNWQPVSQKAGRDGGYRGLVVDILSRFSEETGLEIQYIEAACYKDMVEMTRLGRTDIASAAVRYVQDLHPYEMKLTDSFLTAQMLTIYDKHNDLGKLKSLNVAEVEGYPEFSRNQAITHMYFSTPSECLQAIRSGSEDLMYCDIFTGTACLEKYVNRDLRSFPINTETFFSMGINPKEDPVLTGLLNRVIGGMSRKEINDSLTHNRIDADFAIDDFVYHYPFEIICAVLVTAFLIVLVLGYYYRIKSTQSIAKQGYIQSYQMLANTFGEAGFNYDYMEDKLTVFGKYAERLVLPPVVENFTSYLESREKEISLTRAEFEKMLEDGMTGKSYDMELECKVENGGWEHFRLIFSVIATNESYQRPICMIGCLNNIEREFKEKEHLRYLGMSDRLTGLLNRMGMETRIHEIEDAGTSIREDLLLFIDVDYFKNFNDDYGHVCGDDVLISIGTHLKNIFHMEDILCRWGGDEFFLYLPGAALHVAAIEKKCASLQKAMREYHFDGKRMEVTLSIGGAAVGEKSLEAAFRKADEALYIVKEKGRNGIHIKPL